MFDAVARKKSPAPAAPLRGGIPSPRPSASRPALHFRSAVLPVIVTVKNATKQVPTTFSCLQGIFRLFRLPSVEFAFESIYVYTQQLFSLSGGERTDKLAAMQASLVRTSLARGGTRASGHDERAMLAPTRHGRVCLLVKLQSRCWIVAGCHVARLPGLSAAARSSHSAATRPSLAFPSSLSDVLTLASQYERNTRVAWLHTCPPVHAQHARAARSACARAASGYARVRLCSVLYAASCSLYT